MRPYKLILLALGLAVGIGCGGLDANSTLSTDNGLANPSETQGNNANNGGGGNGGGGTNGGGGGTNGGGGGTNGGGGTTGGGTTSTPFPGGRVSFTGTPVFTSCNPTSGTQNDLLNLYANTSWTIDVGGPVDPTVISDLATYGITLSPADNYFGNTIGGGWTGGDLPAITEAWVMNGLEVDPNTNQPNSAVLTNGLGVATYYQASAYTYTATAADTLDAINAVAFLVDAQFYVDAQGSLAAYRLNGTDVTSTLWLNFLKPTFAGDFSDTTSYCYLAWDLTGQSVTPN